MDRPARRHAVRRPGPPAGVSGHRAGQSLAGAIVADEAMRALGIDRIRICPWGLREGVLLHHPESCRPGPAHAAWTSLPVGRRLVAA